MKTPFFVDKITRNQVRFVPMDQTSQVSGAIYLPKSRLPQPYKTLVLNVEFTQGEPPTAPEEETIFRIEG